MSSDRSGDMGRHLRTAAHAVGLGAFATWAVAASSQDQEPNPQSRRRIVAGQGFQDVSEMPRSRRISEEVVVGSSVARSPDFNEAKNHSLIQAIEHIFKEDEDPAAGYPVTRVKDWKVEAATKLAIVTISGFEIWFGSKDQEIMAAASRFGFHAGLEGDFGRSTLTVKLRGNSRFWGKVDRDWTWRCHVVIQCFGES